MKTLARALLSACLLSSFGLVDSQAAWLVNGTPLTSQWGGATGGAIVSDGSSGAIVLYETCQLGVPRIVAQRITSLGVALWGEDGIVVFTGTSRRDFPEVVSDGSGGAILTWEDERSGSSDIYAQHVDVSGALRWGSDGVPVCVATGAQDDPQLITDGAGGVIITWEDDRGFDDIYAQRLNASGDVQWIPNGVPICTALWSQDDPQIASDDAGGALITWQDSRYSNDGVYAQRVNGAGTRQWATNGIRLCPVSATQRAPEILSDGSGGAIISWQDYRNGPSDIYAQRLDASGDIQWTVEGVGIDTTAVSQDYSQMVSDGAGGAIVTWHDDRTGALGIFAQRVNASGAIQWNAGGIAIRTEDVNQGYPHIVSDGAGGAIITWSDNRNGYQNVNVYAQRVNGSGEFRWTVNGVAVCAVDAGKYDADIVSDGAGGAILTLGGSWSGSYYPDIHAQRLNPSGGVGWTPTGVTISSATGYQRDPQIASDGAGGAIITWNDYRWGNWDIYVQRITSSGEVLWGGDGVPVCTVPGDVYPSPPRIISDGSGGAIVTWHGYQYGRAGIFAQRLNASGAVEWTTNGVAICTAAGNPRLPQIVSDGAGGAFITWQDHRSDSVWFRTDIFAQHVDAAGAVQWTVDGVAVCIADNDQSYSELISDGAGGAIIAWEDHRFNWHDVYAQRVGPSGEAQWLTDGVAVCTAEDDQNNPVLASDGAGGAIIMWEDGRGEATDVYAQRVNGSGQVQWTANGVVVCAAMGWQTHPGVASDEAGGVFVAWDDSRGAYTDIYAQRVSGSGELLWSADGVAVCSAANSKSLSSIVGDGAGGIIITWEDYRSGDWDIYAQRLAASGVAEWATYGVPISTAGGSQWHSGVVSDGDGGAIVTWADGRWSSVEWICAHRILASGELTAILLLKYSVTSLGDAIHLNWELAEVDDSARFTILRASPPGWEYAELAGAPQRAGTFSFAYVDEGSLPGSTYKYRVDFEVRGFPRRILFETEPITVLRLQMALNQNHPNPFVAATTIPFALANESHARLEIFDVQGRLMRTLLDEKVRGGVHSQEWDGRDDQGAQVPNGLYFYRLVVDNEPMFIRKVLRVR